MVIRPRTYLSLCAGGGGLDLAVRLALPACRCLAHCEGEAAAAVILATRMEEGALAPCPIWSDLRTFPSSLFRGKVDLVIGGIPCQPVSTAGSRKGTSDDRWLWPYFWQVVRDVGASYFLLENVLGLLSAGDGSVFGSILGDLAACGWSAEYDVVSAASVGGSHRRERVFVLGQSRGATSQPGGLVGDTKSKGRQGCCPPVRDDPTQDCVGSSQPPRDGGRGRDVSELPVPGNGLPFNPPGPGDLDAWRAVLAVRPDLAPAVETQAAQSAICGVADGLATGAHFVDLPWADRLRTLGNGVYPLAGSVALAILWRRLTGEELC